MPSEGDPGEDGVDGFRTGTDAFAFALGYYEGDYKPINPNAVVSDSRDKLWDRYRDTRDTVSAAGLYNGNISWMSTDLPGLGSNRMQAMVYGYDQLHRIVQARSHTEYETTGYETRTPGPKPYDVDYSYDPNGNLLTLKRLDENTSLRDDLTYGYYNQSNKLKNVDGLVNENYAYDQIGNLISDNAEGIDSIVWTPYGKVRAVHKTGNTSVSFRYDPSGNRIAKIASGDTTVYVRDASGNVMGVYKNDTLIEQSIYGSSRLGLMTSSSKTGYRTLGGKKYELSNHLGNVLAVVSDNINFDQDSTWANVVNMTDYYPFGLAMEGRSLQDSSYRYGFNGQEKEDEIKCSGNSYEFTFRIYDPHTGRFLSVDPIGKNYPHSSPYAFAENDVIRSIDLEGLEKYIVTGRSFIPMETLAHPINPFRDFAGDNRKSYQLQATEFRTEQKVHSDFDKRTVSYSSNIASGTTALDKTGKVIETSESGPAGPVPTFNKSFLENGNSITIQLSVDAPNKLVAGAPSINYQLDITITPSADKKSFEYQVKGASDGFPAYELWITDETNNKSYLLFNRNPIESNEGAGSLFPPMEHTFDLRGNSKNEKSANKFDFKDRKNSSTQ